MLAKAVQVNLQTVQRSIADDRKPYRQNMFALSRTDIGRRVSTDTIDGSARMNPVALGWIDYDNSTAPDYEAAQVQQLARQLGYVLRWADPCSVLGVVEQVEAGEVEVLLLPSSAHVDAATLERVTAVVDVECASPRASFARRTTVGGIRR